MTVSSDHTVSDLAQSAEAVRRAQAALFLARNARNALVSELHMAGMSAKALARSCGISDVAIAKILARRPPS